MGLTGGFAFWPAIMKGIRMTGTDEEQGRMYGIFEALNGLASLLLSFIMIGVMAVVGGSDLITGFKSALAFMGGLSIVSGILVAILMPKDAAYGVSDEEKENQKKITFKDYVSAFKIPGVWIMAILVWCYVTISAVASYLTPYSTGVLGMSATLAATIGEESVTLEDVYEPYLMQLGFLTRTPRGRCVTPLAYDHLHIPYQGQTQFSI